MLTAPAHLRGRLSRHSPEAVKDERLEWIRQRTAEGHLQRDIAAAIGIRTATLSMIMVRAGIRRAPVAPLARVAHRHGLRVGSMVRMFDSLPPDLRNELVAEAISQRCNEIGDVIAKRLTADFPKAGGASG